MLRPGDCLDISAATRRHWALRMVSECECEAATVKRFSAKLSSVIKPTTLCHLHTADVFLNRVTSPHRDRFTGAEYKVTAVRREGLREPLPASSLTFADGHLD